MQISRMDLDDAGASPQRIAEAIIAQIPDLPVPVPVEEIACALDIVEIRVEPLKSFEGALITTGPEKGEGSIVVNAENRRRRRRYTIGHELGHFLHPQHLPPVGGSYCAADDMSRSSSAGMNKSALQEVQANVFAAELLLPRKCFLRDLRGKSGLDLEHVVALAGRYDTSKEATARRYVALQDETCAVVFSHNGRVRYACKHEDFPWLNIHCGDPIPGQSIAARWIGANNGASDWADIDAGVWMSKAGRRTVVEQTLVQQGGYRMTLLALDDEDDEDDLEERWAPRFRR